MLSEPLVDSCPNISQFYSALVVQYFSEAEMTLMHSDRNNGSRAAST